MKVADFLLRRPVVVECDATLATAARLMVDRGVGSVIVVDAGRPVGIVTDRDLVTRGLAKELPADARVDAVMTMGLVSLDESADLEELMALFSTHAIRRIPIVADGGHEVIGVVALDDLLVSLVAHLGDVGKVLAGQIMFPHAGDEPPVPART